MADYESFIDIEGIGAKKVSLIRKCFRGNLKDCLDSPDPVTTDLIEGGNDSHNLPAI